MSTFKNLNIRITYVFGNPGTGKKPFIDKMLRENENTTYFNDWDKISFGNAILLFMMDCASKTERHFIIESNKNLHELIIMLQKIPENTLKQFNSIKDNIEFIECTGIIEDGEIKVKKHFLHFLEPGKLPSMMP